MLWCEPWYMLVNIWSKSYLSSPLAMPEVRKSRGSPLWFDARNQEKNVIARGQTRTASQTSLLLSCLLRPYLSCERGQEPVSHTHRAHFHSNTHKHQTQKTYSNTAHNKQTHTDSSIGIPQAPVNCNETQSFFDLGSTKMKLVNLQVILAWETCVCIWQ